MEKEICFLGKPLSQCTKEELIDAVKVLFNQNQDLSKQWYESEQRVLRLMGDTIKLKQHEI